MNNSEAHIIFELSGSHYGLRSSEVMHIDLLEQITPVPNTIASVEGVVFTRGQVVPVLNLRTRFGLDRISHSSKSRLIVARLHSRVVALAVDSAREFRTISADAIKPVQENMHGISGNFVRGTVTIGDRMILLLDLEAVLSPEEIPESSSGAEA